MGGRGPLVRKHSRAAWLQKFHLRQPGAVKELRLDIQGRTGSLDDALAADAVVQDGLGVVAGKSFPPAIPDEAGAVDIATHALDLLSAAVVRRLSMPEAHRIRIRQTMLIPARKTYSAGISINGGALRALGVMRESLPEVKEDRQWLVPEPPIRAAAQISELPQRRKSADLSVLNESERTSFLREAEVLKGVPSGRAELLAVFRHVPIEVISQLRFLAEKNEILYSVPGKPLRTQTRVHDMAVIRDTANQELYLIPHRTQSRPVFLT